MTALIGAFFGSAGWLLVGHEARMALHEVTVWPDGFELEDLLATVQLALAV
jgi:hypothetical protein